MSTRIGQVIGAGLVVGVGMAYLPAMTEQSYDKLYVGGEWQWLVQREGRDVAEGAARASLAARQQAEAVAHRITATLG